MANALKRRLGAFDFEPTFRPNFNELERAAQRAARRLGGGEVEVTPEDVDTLFHGFRSEWADHHELERLSRRIRRWFPHLLFYPPQAPAQWLAHDEALKIAVRRHMESPRNARALISLCHAFLRAFPINSAAFETYADLCSTSLAKSTGIRSQAMRAASARFRLFSADGPTEVAKFWLMSKDNITAMRDMPELSVLTSDSRFNHHLAFALLASVRGDLEQGAQLSPTLLERKLALVPGATTRGTTLDPDLRKPLAEALLQPFVRNPTPEGYKEWARPFVLRHMDDPRRRPVAWSAVNKTACDVMLRWLVEATIDQFFHVLDKTAKDRHWKDRKAFWKGYLKKGAINNAWVLLGTDAARFVRRTFDDESAHFGRLKGAQASQSVLLMQFGPSLVVAEWSHDGACHFWDDPEAAPEFFRHTYTGTELRSRSVTKVNHVPAHRPRQWQATIALTIEDYSSIQHPILGGGR
jgi:hypothetical protein